MESSIERISEVECRVKVEIPWDEVSGRLSAKMKDLQRRARLPGFRPGKVPPQVLERMFGKGVREELAQDLVQETFQTAVTRHETVPLTQPVVESYRLYKGEAFTYDARFEVPPRIQPKDYVGVPVRRRPAKADEAKVAAELERKREELAELRPLAEDETREITAPHDVWTIDVDGEFAGQVTVNNIVGGSARFASIGYWIDKRHAGRLRNAWPGRRPPNQSRRYVRIGRRRCRMQGIRAEARRGHRRDGGEEGRDSVDSRKTQASPY